MAPQTQLQLQLGNMTGVYHGDDLVSFLLFIIFYFVIIEDKDKRNVVKALDPT